MDIKTSEQAIEYIHSLSKFGIKPGLERISELLSYLGNPQNSLKFIHVAGTNGKGTTSTFISNILSAAGFNVGLYTSPYVLEFRERIRYNGEMIPNDYLVKYTSMIKDVIDNQALMITEFEFETAIAFLYYAEVKADYVVLEVGLGGRFDATNVIENKIASVIVSISMDHIQILGDTIEKIAYEKCGIIVKNGTTISYPLQNADALTVIKGSCLNKNNTLIIPEIDCLNITNRNIFGTDFYYKNVSYHVNLAGDHIVYNSITAIETILSLDLDISTQTIANGLKNTLVPARIEVLSDDPIIILDGGHNEDCANALSKYIESNISGRNIICISSLMADKDVETYISKIVPYSSLFIATKADNPRVINPNELCNLACKYTDNSICIPNPEDAVDFALDNLKDDMILLICGSFYLAGDIRKYIIEKRNNNA